MKEMMLERAHTPSRPEQNDSTREGAIPFSPITQQTTSLGPDGPNETGVTSSQEEHPITPQLPVSALVEPEENAPDLADPSLGSVPKSLQSRHPDLRD